MKDYWLGDICPHCEGNGKLPIKFDSHRITWTDQDGGRYWVATKFTSLEDARTYGKKALDKFVYYIIAPNGEICKNQ